MKVKQTANWWDPEAVSRNERLTSSGPDNSPLPRDDWQTWATLIAGTALLGYGMSRRDKLGLVSSVSGSALLYRGAKLASQSEDGILAGMMGEQSYQRSVTIARKAAELFALWTPQHLPVFLPHVKSVSAVGEQRQHWVLRGPMGKEIAWEAEIISQVPGRSLTWQNVDGPVEEWGSISFMPTRLEETEVTLSLSYRLPGGTVGSWLAAAFGREPRQLVRESLRRFKQYAETGEVATTFGQPAGRRGLSGRTAQLLTGENAGQERAAV